MIILQIEMLTWELGFSSVGGKSAQSLGFTRGGRGRQGRKTERTLTLK